MIFWPYHQVLPSSLLFFWEIHASGQKTTCFFWEFHASGQKTTCFLGNFMHQVKKPLVFSGKFMHQVKKPLVFSGKFMHQVKKPLVFLGISCIRSNNHLFFWEFHASGQKTTCFSGKFMHQVKKPLVFLGISCIRSISLGGGREQPHVLHCSTASEQHPQWLNTVCRAILALSSQSHEHPCSSWCQLPTAWHIPDTLHFWTIACKKCPEAVHNRCFLGVPTVSCNLGLQPQSLPLSQMRCALVHSPRAG